MLNVVGTYDYFARGGFAAYTSLTHDGVNEPTRTGQRLVVGPWNHYGSKVRPDADPTVGIHFDVSPDSPAMRFYAHHLKGELPGYADERRSAST